MASDFSRSAEVPEPRQVQEARAIRREAREHLGLAGGVVIVGGLAGNAAGILAALPVAAVLLAGIGAAYAIPLTRRGKWAQGVLAEIEVTRTYASQADDPRVISAEAIAGRIQSYVGSGAPSAAAAGAMVELIHESLEDLRAVDLLRAASGAGVARRAEYGARAEALAARVNDRIDHALAVITEIYEAVLSQDDLALREIVARADAEVRRIQAEDEVDRLLEPRRPGDPG